MKLPLCITKDKNLSESVIFTGSYSTEEDDLDRMVSQNSQLLAESPTPSEYIEGNFNYLIKETLMG